MKRLMWLVVVVLIVLGLGAVRMKRVNQMNSAPLLAPVAPVVEVAPARQGHVARTRHVTGVVVAETQATVEPMIMARILEVRVREGDRVRQGDVLAVLDSRELEQSLSQARAGINATRSAVAAAEASWQTQKAASERDQVLFEAKAISEEQWEQSHTAEILALARLDTAKAELEAAGKRRDQAATRSGYSQLEAPFSGSILQRFADAGDLGMPGKPILSLARDNGIRVRAQVPAEDLTAIKTGLPVRLSLADSLIEASISRVVPAMDSSRLAVFEVDLSTPPAGFVPGATVAVDLELEGADGLVLPVNSLLEGETATWAFLVDNDIVKAVMVEISSRSAHEAVVVADISAGDLVVTARPSRLMMLSDGMTVRVNGSSL